MYTTGKKLLRANEAYNAVQRRSKDENDKQMDLCMEKISKAIEDLKYFCEIEQSLCPPVIRNLTGIGYRVKEEENKVIIDWSNPNFN